MWTVFWLGGVLWIGAAEASKPVDYATQIKPLLREHCFACHGVLKQESGLRLDSGKLIASGGDSGPAVIAGQPEQSNLLERISADTDSGIRMPSEGKGFSEEQISLFRRWIEEGATFPATDAPEPDPEEHWAFRSPVRPSLPAVSNPGWARNPIDLFLLQQHERHGLATAGPATKEQLLRRVYIDLIGVPPTRQQLQQFLQSTDPFAYEKVVEVLLADPKHGERWARHWMDVWRYSDWYGRRSVPDVMNSYPQIWRWRDWIVRCLNSDRGYDHMVRMMLAADELAPDDREELVATGFLVRNWFKWNYEQWMKDLVEHTGKAFLGLTLNCCHCHDHKYDPITQKEYFQFRAFFEPLELRHDRVPGTPAPGPFRKYVYTESYGPIAGGMIRVFDEKLEAQTFMYSKGDSRSRIEGEPPVPPGVPSLLCQLPTVQRVQLPATAWYPGLRSDLREEDLAKRHAELASAKAAFEQWKQQSPLARDIEEEIAQALQRYRQRSQELAAMLEQDTAALSGLQSLVLDARQGRKLLGLAPGNTGNHEGQLIIRLQLRILDDGLTNFQLAKSLSKGHTAAMVQFENGVIQTYLPSSASITQIGRYSPGNPDTYNVTFTIDFAKDELQVAVTGSNGEVLASSPTTLNGWNPFQHADQGIFIDARTGTRVVYDDIIIGAGKGWHFDFEPPRYWPGDEIVQHGDWFDTSFSQAPATATVADWLSRPAELQELWSTVTTERLKQHQKQLQEESGLASVQAAEASLTSLQARIAADDVRYLSQPGNAQELTQQAVAAERQEKLAVASAAMLKSQLKLIEAKIAQDQAAINKASQEVQQATQNLQQVQSAEPAEPAADYTPLSPQYPKESTGRRSVLAEWITNPNHPLTARVAVNHLWSWHFHSPLVSTTSDFGRNGQAPSHPELLDWLTAEFVEHGWSMKHLHRLIVTSSAYRMSSADPAVAENEAKDPDNRWLWRFPTARMEAEVIRDSVLHLAGRLELTMFGQEIEHSLGMTVPRRTLYFSIHGESKMQFIDLFDGPNVCDCYRRTTSLVPQQALALSNSEFVLQNSRWLTQQLLSDRNLSTDRDFVEAAFLQILTRHPAEREIVAALGFLDRQHELFQNDKAMIDIKMDQVQWPAIPSQDPSVRAKESLVHVLLNHNDFVTLR